MSHDLRRREIQRLQGATPDVQAGSGAGGVGMDTGGMSWSVHAVPLPDGDRPADLWVDEAGCLTSEPVPAAERLPGRYVMPGLVDAHAHPTVGGAVGGPVALGGAEALDLLAAWAACGVCLVRDAGSPGGLVLELDLAAGMPRLQAAGRFLAPAGRYFPALLPEGAPEHQLTELARGGQWVKLKAFPRERLVPCSTRRKLRQRRRPDALLCWRHDGMVRAECPIRPAYHRRSACTG